LASVSDSSQITPSAVASIGSTKPAELPMATTFFTHVRR
jgi:hypothetical protein